MITLVYKSVDDMNDKRSWRDVNIINMDSNHSLARNNTAAKTTTVDGFNPLRRKILGLFIYNKTAVK